MYRSDVEILVATEATLASIEKLEPKGLQSLTGFYVILIKLISHYVKLMLCH